MMKKQLILSIFLLCSYIVYPQQNNTVHKREIQTGKNLQTGKIITGNCYNFPGKILDINIDSATNTATVQLRNKTKDQQQLSGKGTLLRYDLTAEKILWETPINYNNGDLFLTENKIIRKNGKYNQYLNPENGTTLWQTTTNLHYLFPKLQIGIGYPYKILTQSDKLAGINLSDAGTAWERKISREYGWNDMIYINDTNVLIVSDGLHLLNLKTGKGWDYTTATGNKNYPGNNIREINSTVPGIFIPPYGLSVSEQQIHGLVSNVIIQDSKIYIASTENISCLNENGEKIWSTNLPQELTGKSWIFIQNQQIYMINSGYAYSKWTPVKYGTPDVAAYNINSGKKEYLELQESTPILDYLVKENSLYLLSENKITQINLANGSLIKKTTLSPSAAGELCRFVKTPLYRINENNCKDLTADTKQLYITNNRSELLILNTELETTEKVNRRELFPKYIETCGQKFIAQNGKIILLNRQLTPIAQFNTGNNIILQDNKLFTTSDSDLIEINLQPFITDQKH